jgi:predicted nucleic acid-binding protein
MKRVLVDTSVWSLALRKKDATESEQRIIAQLSTLILDLDLVIIGPVRQEILSGISDQKKFTTLRERLSIFEDFPITTHDYEVAAQFLNECRNHGIQGSYIDFLICAVAANHDMSILTLDQDFQNYQEYIKIRVEKIA